MPNREVHASVGMAAGGTFAAFRAAGQPGPHQFLEVLGGAGAGYVGGLLPDTLEPAIHPGHRQFAHSVAFGAGVMTGCGRCLDEWEQFCRARANETASRRSTYPAGSLESLALYLLEVLWRMLSGALAGFTGGYLSHLVMDAGTPRSIRLI